MSGANGADYVYQNYTFSFKEGDETKDLEIITIDDNIVESDETYTLVIHLTGTHKPVLIGKNNTTKITIYDDDGKEIATNLCNSKLQVASYILFYVAILNNILAKPFDIYTE